MQNLKSLLFIAIILLIPLFYFSACSEKADVSAPDQLDFDSPQFAVIDYNDVLNGIEDATLDSNMTFNTTLANYSFMSSMNSFSPGNQMMNRNPWLMHFDMGKHLGLFFRGLNLTDAQKSQIRDQMTQFHATIKPLVQQFKDANADIIAKANADRKAIADSVKAGTLTRAQASVKIKTLNETTRDAIKNNPKSIEIKKEMCDEKANLFAEIAKILTPDQLVKWNNRISRIPDPCS
ncbi:MAG: Spy/CpxP family protein refolding chaperone [Ignavibacteriales bacterium]|nr:Spy/CpxP family protein refolding chaperone [Ignavibacteriales bacterium]